MAKKKATRAVNAAQAATASGAFDAMGLPNLYMAPGHLIRRCQQIAVAIFMEEFRDWRITPVQYAALIAIRERPGMEQSSLVKHIAIDRSTVGTLLKSMEERKLIRRVVPAENQRIKQLYITAQGTKVLTRTKATIFEVQERILAPLNAGEREQFMRLLAKVVHINNELSRAPLQVESSDLR